MDTTLFLKAEQWVKANMPPKDDLIYTFHNWKHAKSVVESTQAIALAEGISPEQTQELLFAALFHDFAYAKDPKNHESVSADAAVSFLGENNVNEEICNRIRNLILSTNLSHEPSSISEKIIRDADLSHLGSPKFLKKTEELRFEKENIHKIKKSDLEWLVENIQFLKSVKYNTTFAITQYSPYLEQNILQLESMKNQIENPSSPILENKRMDPSEASLGAISLFAKKKDRKNYGRGVETLFRTTSHNHIILSQIADTKANIMITINAGIMSYLMAKVFSMTTSNLFFLPICTLFFFSVISIISAILATRPQITSGTFSLDDVVNQKTNLLFFGNFHNMSLVEYEQGITKLLDEETILYNSMIKDIYFLGKVLGKKYKLVRLSYTSFMIGFILFVLLGGVSYLIIH